MNAPDLAQRPPRSPRVRLGGYAMLPRVLDKARASLIGTAGDYKFGNPMDQHFFGFTGIAPAALLEQVKTGAGDWTILLWVNAQANPKRLNPARTDLHTVMDYLDADDHASFGGQA